MRVRIGLVLVLLLLAFSGCHRQEVYTQTVSVNPEGWASKDLATFELDMADTLTPCELDLHLRHDGRYRFSNLFLFVTTLAPTGEQIRDTIECTLADPGGKWFGKGIGGQYQYTFRYKNQVVFPYSGRYRFEIEHGMRVDPLPWIKDIGLTVRKIKQ